MGNDVVVASTFPPARLTRIDNSVSVSSVTSKMLLSPVSSNSYPLVVRLVGGFVSVACHIQSGLGLCGVVFVFINYLSNKRRLVGKSKSYCCNSIYHSVDPMGADTVCLELVSV